MPRRTKIDAQCDECAKEMALGRDRKNDCKPCRNKRRSVQAAMAREAKGLLPWGTATDAYRVRQDAERRIKRIADRDKRAADRAALGLPAYGSGLRNPVCRCGATKEWANNSQCAACNREKMRLLRLKRKAENPNFAIEERAKRQAHLHLDDLHRFKVSVRHLTLRAIGTGILIRQPCEVCGLEKVDAHHDDYTKPLEVRWLCRKHHNRHHKNIIEET